MALRVLVIVGMALALVGCHQPSEEAESLGSPSIPIVVVPPPPELTYEENLAQQHATDKGPIDLSTMVWPTENVTFQETPSERLVDVLGRIRNKVEPILAEKPPEEHPKKTLQGSVRAEDSVEQYADAHEDQDRLRGYKWAKRLAAMDVRLCNQGTPAFNEGCRDGMRDDAAEFQRDLQ